MERSLLPTVPMLSPFKHPLITIWKHVLVQLLLESAAWQSKWIGLALCPSSRARHVGSLTTQNLGVLNLEALNTRPSMRKGFGKEAARWWLRIRTSLVVAAVPWQKDHSAIVLKEECGRRLRCRAPGPRYTGCVRSCTQVLDRAAGWTEPLGPAACWIVKAAEALSSEPWLTHKVEEGL